MRTDCGTVARRLCLAAALAALAACGEPGSDPRPAANAAAPRVFGFVFSRWGVDIPTEQPGDCPDGLNTTDREVFAQEYAAVADERKRLLDAGDYAAASALLPPDACRHPEQVPDPGHKLMTGPASVVGIDLDGRDSRQVDGGACPHDDFVGADGSAGIDNQYLRLMGCVRGYRPGDLYDRTWESDGAVLENAHAMLLEVTLLDGDLHDGRVSARLFSGAGPVTTDARGAVMRDASHTVVGDSAFHSAPFAGEIEDGVLTAGSVDAALKFSAQGLDTPYRLRDLRIRARLQPDGGMQGVLAGYWDSRELFRFMTDIYTGDRHRGRDKADTIGYQCAGVYHALPRVADGHPDPQTGKCTSVSTVFRFAAVPAFIIPPEGGA